MLNTLQKLSALTAPSGLETAVEIYISDRAASLGLSARRDPLGNLLVEKPGAVHPARPVVLTAYMDEPGMMIRNVTDEGFFRFGLTGPTDPRTILGKTVLAGAGAYPGVVGRKPIHLTTPQERKTMPAADDLYLDLGAADRAAGESLAGPGDYAVFAPEFLELGTNALLAKAMGRSVGCSVLLSVMEQPLPVDVTFVFTTQRQVGSRGAMAAAARLRPGVAIALELCPGDGEKQPKLGNGPVLPAVDKSAIYDRDLTVLLRSAAPGPIQPWATVDTDGDGGVFQRSGGGAKTAALCCPARYCSGPAPVIDRRDLEAVPKLLLSGLAALKDRPWL